MTILTHPIWRKSSGVGTRVDPSSIETIQGTWASGLDPILSPEKRARGELTHTTGIIMACKPYHWIDQFPHSFKPTMKPSKDKGEMETVFH